MQDKNYSQNVDCYAVMLGIALKNYSYESGDKTLSILHDSIRIMSAKNPTGQAISLGSLLSTAFGY